MNTAISDPMKLNSNAVAAAALFGWLLMAPSVDCARRGLENETPLSQWEKVDEFSSSDGCNQYRATVIESQKADRGNVYVDRYSNSVCVPADDPRLKAK